MAQYRYEARNLSPRPRNMNAELYEKWFEEKVLPGLTIIVLDNARYHSPMVETRPSSSRTK
jgi:hypothetical protein